MLFFLKHTDYTHSRIGGKGSKKPNSCPIPSIIYELVLLELKLNLFTY